MCLAVPGEILTISEREGCRVGVVRFGGIQREACLDFVPEARAGDYVIVHVGFAISLLDAAEAKRTHELLQAMDRLERERALARSEP